MSPCEKNPCGKHGKCIIVSNTFKCKCMAGESWASPQVNHIELLY